ncbi:MAG: right-handed parallel beta-helix repeat-containing protein [Pseudomonadota bacterium]
MYNFKKAIGSAASALVIAIGITGVQTTAHAQDGKIGGFDIPGSITSKTRPNTERRKTFKKRSEVVVSQSSGSKVRTIQQAMRVVQPGGTIIVRGGVYTENVDVTKPVAIIGAVGDYGREPIIRPVSSAPCLSIAPGTPVARVSVEKMLFEFDHERASGPCIDVQGGSVALRDSAILPIDADIPIRAAYGQLRSDQYRREQIARPPRDKSDEALRLSRLESYISRHARPVGADNKNWDFITGGSDLVGYSHVAKNAMARSFSGPVAGVRVSAGEVELNNNTIIGTQTAVEFESLNRALVNGSLSNNIIVGNGDGISAGGRLDDLLVTRNTIKFNNGAGIAVDARDGYGEVKILANLIMGNEMGVYLSEKVRAATVNSNLIAQNIGDAMQMSSGFFGAIAGNTFADNDGCTVQFFSAEQKELNDAYIKVIAGEDFDPRFNYDETNYAIDNIGDAGKKRKKRRRKKRDYGMVTLPECAATL